MIATLTMTFEAGEDPIVLRAVAALKHLKIEYSDGDWQLRCSSPSTPTPRLDLHQPQDDVGIALARPTQGLELVRDGRLDPDQALALGVSAQVRNPHTPRAIAHAASRAGADAHADALLPAIREAQAAGA